MLDMIQADLRKKYVNEIEAIQRRVSGDEESWTTLDQTMKEIGIHYLTDLYKLKFVVK